MGVRFTSEYALAARNAELEAALKRDPDMIRRARERLARQREEARREREAREAEKARALEEMRKVEAALEAEQDAERKVLMQAQLRLLAIRAGLGPQAAAPVKGGSAGDQERGSAGPQ
jgi:hypothetical protein